MTGLTGNDFGNRNAFVFGLVRQHRTLHHVADGIDAFDIGAPMVVDCNTATIIDIHARFLKAKTVRVRTTAGRDQNRICFKCLCITALHRFEGHFRSPGT